VTKAKANRSILKKQRGRQPTTDYFSSSDPDNLGEPNRVLALGEKIVQELELTDGVDTLGKWMAHHLASIIEDAKGSDGAQTAANQEAVDLIFRLWEHRASMPGTADPMSALNRAMGVLDRIGPNSSPFYRHSQDMLERDLALLFDGLRKLVAHGVILVSGQKEIPEYTADTFEHLAEEEQQFIMALGGWLSFLEQQKPTTPVINVVFNDDEQEKKKAEEEAKLESLEPEERSKILLSQSIDDLVENLQAFKAKLPGQVDPSG
jgi:hypothetical protein